MLWRRRRKSRSRPASQPGRAGQGKDRPAGDGAGGQGELVVGCSGNVPSSSNLLAVVLTFVCRLSGQKPSETVTNSSGTKVPEGTGVLERRRAPNASHPDRPVGFQEIRDMHVQWVSRLVSRIS